MNDYRKYFTSFIRSHYPEEGERLIARTDQYYRIISKDVLFAKTSKNPIDRRLDFSAYFLALIKTLDERGEAFSKIREICLQITTAYVQPKNGIQAFFKRLLPRLITTGIGQVLIKSFHKRVSVNSHPDGFVAHILTDRQEPSAWATDLTSWNAGSVNCSRNITTQSTPRSFARWMKSLPGLPGFN